ncbi:hypothetical protein ITP53_13965 [Nonomuraea sp. K274]|uniref:Twin-arginine translocation signal domain-containing protein n=1 Tax=Nonomuraea cypriaca TaxID=1187855 RepID=A0A931EWL0_9ACTN|nr:hypothetical protein [Nonomuraea cypriaca]MBF8186829.1 hypothetical protein [Nonomuraea cypriaca]
MTERPPLTRRSFLTAAAAAALTPTLISTPAFAMREPYPFPVRPGTPEWARLKTREARIRATQLPDGMAAAMTTDDLVSTVLDYPLLSEALAFNSVQRGFETVAARFNGFSELLRRRDAGPALLSRYAALDVHVPTSADLLAAGTHVVDVWRLETLLAQPEVLGTLSAGETASALRTAHQTYAVKQAEQAYGPAGLEPTATLLGRALATREGWTWNHLPLLSDGIAPTTAEASAVVRAVEQHFAEPGKTHRVRTPNTTMDHLSTVYTARGTPVTVSVHTIELSAALIAKYNGEADFFYIDATRETDATRTYNCHAYAWYSTSPFGNVWMNDPGDNTYWLDGTYRQWFSPETYRNSMRWSWVHGDHSGVEVDATGVIVSKWGQWGRMRHAWHDSPYVDSVTYKYYRNQ